VDEQMNSGSFRAGETLELAQPSARRRSYELRRGDQVIGWLGFPPGRRSVALAEGTWTGSLALTARSGRVEVHSRPDGTMLATVEGARGGGAVLRIVDAPPLRWHRTGRRRWAVDDGALALLQVTTAHGPLRASARITVEQELPGYLGVALALIIGFLAFRKLQAEIDAGAAVGGIVATGAG
jgi:hypothetical protein